MESYSALVPIKNGINYLPRFKSFFEAIPENFEIVVIDDDSSDGTSNFLNHWRKSDDRISIIKGPGQGIVKALNLGLRAINSDWIFRFDVDDTYRTERIATQLSMVNKSNMVACFSDYEISSEFDEYLGYMPSAIFPSATYLSLISSNRTAHPSVMLRREALIAAGGYTEEDFPCEDLGLWLRLKKVGDLYSIPTPLLKWRLSSSSLTSLNRSSMQSKKYQLINDLFDFEKARREFFSDSENVLVNYKDLSYGSERKLLYIYDFVKTNRMRDKGEFRDFSSISKYLGDFGNIGALTHLSYYQLKRKFYRKSQSRPRHFQVESNLEG